MKDFDGESFDSDTILRVAFHAFAFEHHYEIEGLVENQLETHGSIAGLLLSYLTAFTEPIPESLADPRIETEVQPAF